MTRKQEIEARLDRSLANQVRAPRLDGRFDAAVWARIEAAAAPLPASPAVPSAATRAGRWLLVTNLAGGAVVAVLLVGFLFKYFGADVPQVPAASELPWTLPAMSEVTVDRLLSIAGYVTAGAALAFVASLTSFGRRMRTSLSF